jgi:deoxyadenosine/deoxycytidine kinase
MKRARDKSLLERKSFVCIEGNIGIGKTTLVKKLARRFKVDALFEEFDENPWLPLFYENPREVALALELSFLTDRSKQLLKVKKKRRKILFSDYCLDKCLLFTETNLPVREYRQYRRLHASVSETVVQPDAVIVIHSDTKHLLSNIKKRNRSYEKKMKTAYLDKLNRSYKKFFGSGRPYPVLHLYIGKPGKKTYDHIFGEIVSFLQQKKIPKNTIRHL